MGNIFNGTVKFYSAPLGSRGLTFNITVASGQVMCYISAQYRNPNSSHHDWSIRVKDYWESFFQEQDGRKLYVSVLGIDAANSYRLNSTTGDALTLGTTNLLYTVHTLPQKVLFQSLYHLLIYE